DAGVPCRGRELLAGQVFLAGPGANDREQLNYIRSREGVPFDWKQLDRSPTLSQRVLLSPKSCVDQAKHAKGRSIIGLGANYFLLFTTGSVESCARCSGVAARVSD